MHAAFGQVQPIDVEAAATARGAIRIAQSEFQIGRNSNAWLDYRLEVKREPSST